MSSRKLRSPEHRHIAGAVGAVAKHNGENDPRLPALRRDLRAIDLEEHARRVVATFPPITDQQRQKIIAILRPASRPAAEDDGGDAA